MTMTFRPVVAGTTDVSVIIRIVDSADGTPETTVVYNTAGIDIRYRRDGATDTAITEATLATLDAAHADGGFLHIGNGYYRVDLPDAACAAGVNGVLVHGTVTGMVVIGCYVPLLAVNPYDAVRMGMTSLPNAAAAASGGLFTRGTGAGQINQDANGRIDVNLLAIGSDTQSATDLKDFADAGYDPATNKVQGVVLTDTATNLTNAPTAGDFTATMKTSIGTAVAASAVASVTGNVGGTVNGLTSTAQGNVRTAVGLATANIDTQLAGLDGGMVSIDGNVNTILADTTNIKTRIPAALVSGRIDASVGAVATGVIAAASFAANALDAVWSTATRLLTAGTNIVLAKGTGVTGFNDLSAAQVNAEVDAAIVDAAFRFGLHAEGTLSGTHSSTTADLGTAAPSGDVSNYVLYIPSRTFIKIIDSYDTGTGVATFEATAATLTDGDPWYLFATPTASAANPIPADVKRVNNTAIIGDGSSGNKFRGNP